MDVKPIAGQHIKKTSTNFTSAYFENSKHNKTLNCDVFIKKAAVSFKGQQYKTGYYTDYEVELAQKYLHAKNFDKYLREDIWDSKSGWDKLWGNYIKDTQYTLDEAKCLINELRQNDSNSDSKLIELESKIKKTESDILNNKNKQDEITEGIEKQKEINKQKRKEIKKIELEQKKIDYLKDNINNVFILPIKAEAKLTKGENLIVLNALNGIMVSGASPIMMEALINMVKRNTSCTLQKIDFEKLSEKEVIKTLGQIAKNSQESGQRTLIQIDNFEKLTLNKPENESIIGKLKNFLQCCASKYKCTVITNVDEPLKLSPEINADHRFKIHLDTKNISNESIIETIQVLDGYNLKFGEEPGENVNLFLGNSGYDNNVLWIDSSSDENILFVEDNLGKIIEIEKFKNIKKIQCPEPLKTENLVGYHRLENRYTYDGKPIYEKIMN